MRSVGSLLLGFVACLSVWAGEHSAARQNLVALLVACCDGDAQSVRALLHKDQSLAKQILTTDEQGQVFTPLSVAACGGYTEIVRLLIGAGADANSRRGPAALPPLLQVCMQDLFENAELPASLLKALSLSGLPHTDQPEPSQNTSSACPRDHLACLRTLIDNRGGRAAGPRRLFASAPAPINKRTISV